ncbi:AmmeMemoRadiSam system protein B [Legionella waltersii]|uniref:MEMO1 family protein Lwal_0645 n=1 Tax=Legionella waltersii TaxID=66969 RepID=A0A0W1AMN8_9GAMM|nr:AmmeMemoRadiSam system protein B [Legionella waltersii]KTD82528.1 putative dioxygenase [Legionella waltersii]SNV03067.1 putative dioxygenase [Legionella waltersii]
MNVHQAAVAGYFYPSDPALLKKTIQDLINNAPVYTPIPKAIIVPHAGYVYSGPIAATSYASLASKKNSIKKIVILGPAHTLYFKGIAYDPVDEFATPLGLVDQDNELLQRITDLPFVHSLAEAHQREHCLEVQLPFCQMIFEQFKVLPLVVGDTKPQEVAEVLRRVWGDEETLIIISTDLSHYLPYEIACLEDKKTCFSIDTLNYEAILHEGACGYFPLRGFLHYARQHNIVGRLLDLRNSGDTAGDKDRVVGYAAFHFYDKLSVKDHCAEELKKIAKDSIRLKTEENKLLRINYKEYHPFLQLRLPTFVTLKKHGMLRGCMGSLVAKDLLADNVINNSLRAAFSDPRFPQVEAKELNDISLSISLLSPLAELSFTNEEELKSQIRQGIDGLILICGAYQATFLPSVWESIASKEEFLSHLKVKMGLSPDFWSSEMKAMRYTAEYIE